MVNLQLHLEDLENKSRRNNLRLRGLPEATDTEDFSATVSAIFQRVLKSPLLTVELDRVHRALGPRSNNPERPRYVVCHLHLYPQKEQILRSAWEASEIEFDGAPIKILLDLSRATLQRRARLRPVLDLIRDRHCTYR